MRIYSDFLKISLNFRPVSLDDIESLDNEFHQSLTWLKENEISDPEWLGMTFAVTGTSSPSVVVKLNVAIGPFVVVVVPNVLSVVVACPVR